MAGLERLISPFARELTVLFVEDDAATRLRMSAELRGVFKEVILATHGQEGLEAFATHRPQIILTDDQMPVMSGIAMTEEIRKVDPKVPIIFITASMDTALLVRAINLGISAFVPKPVVQDNLRQAVSLVVGLLENDHLQRKNVEQELALLQFREKYHEHQQEMAFRKELSILENDFRCHAFAGVEASGRGEWISQVVYLPHDIMCGDSYSLRRLPDGSLLAFIADAMGKGLSASLTTSLSVTIFNLQVDALPTGVPIDFTGFVHQCATLLRKRLLEDEVFSFCLAHLPVRGAWLETAAFGMPPLLVGTPGEWLRKIPSNNPPVSAYLEEFRTTCHDLGPARAILLYTDGLNEAITQDGSLYRDRLDADFLASGSQAQFLAAFRASVAVPDDDVTFLRLQRLDAGPRWHQRLVIPSRLAEVERAGDAVEQLLEAHAGLGMDARSELGMAIREALMNAYEHGSLEVSADLKRKLLEEGSYFDHLLEHERNTDRHITIDLSLQDEAHNHLLKVIIQDEGPGFEPPTTWFGESDSLMLSGRGLRMVKKYTDAFHFSGKGHAITLVKIYRGES